MCVIDVPTVDGPKEIIRPLASLVSDLRLGYAHETSHETGGIHRDCRVFVNASQSLD